MSHEANKALAAGAAEHAFQLQGRLIEMRDDLNNTAARINHEVARVASGIQALQQGALAVLAADLPGNDDLREAVDLVASAKSELRPKLIRVEPQVEQIEQITAYLDSAAVQLGYVLNSLEAAG
jgi:cell division protein ZapA (FtsZ GTPase activity inhibitor)